MVTRIKIGDSYNNQYRMIVVNCRHWRSLSLVSTVDVKRAFAGQKLPVQYGAVLDVTIYGTDKLYKIF